MDDQALRPVVLEAHRSAASRLTVHPDRQTRKRGAAEGCLSYTAREAADRSHCPMARQVGATARLVGHSQDRLHRRTPHPAGVRIYGRGQRGPYRSLTTAAGRMTPYGPPPKV